MIDEKLETLIRDNEALRLENTRLKELNTYLNSENNYLKNLIDKLLDKKENSKE